MFLSRLADSVKRSQFRFQDFSESALGQFIDEHHLTGYFVAADLLTCEVYDGLDVGCCFPRGDQNCKHRRRCQNRMTEETTGRTPESQTLSRLLYSAPVRGSRKPVAGVIRIRSVMLTRLAIIQVYSQSDDMP